MIPTLLILSFLAAVIPCGLFCLNLRRYLPPPPAAEDLPAVSILIPARNEAEGIAAAIASACTTRGIPFELVLMDDSSTDATAQIIREAAFSDPRIRLEQAPPLPPGWNGKQHACWALAQAARNPILCFVDADVRLAPDCIARMVTFLNTPVPAEGALAPACPALVSGFPRQLTGTPLEWLLIPLIHFVLLGFLPLGRMRKTTNPGYAAGCGQFLMCDREAYFATGGHSNIRLTMHDGLRLPKLFREHGYATDLADLTDLASVRMYTNARDTWQGLAKNAPEGLGAPTRILPITILLLLGQVLPFSFAAWTFYVFSDIIAHDSDGFVMIDLALGLLTATLLLLPTLLPRILAARRFRQSWRSALLHPLGILLLLAVQWYALLRKLRGGQTSWRGRSYTKTSS